MPIIIIITTIITHLYSQIYFIFLRNVLLLISTKIHIHILFVSKYC